MKKILSLLAIGLALSFSMAHAADDGKTKQQNKMGECNASAGDKKGDERKAHMKSCLSAKPAAAPMTQGQKMGACAKEASAKGLKGDEANKFKSECSKAK